MYYNRATMYRCVEITGVNYIPKNLVPPAVGTTLLGSSHSSRFHRSAETAFPVQHGDVHGCVGERKWGDRGYFACDNSPITANSALCAHRSLLSLLLTILSYCILLSLGVTGSPCSVRPEPRAGGGLLGCVGWRASRSR